MKSKNIKRILIGLAILCILSVTITSIYATQNTNVGGINFNIPNGFTEDTTYGDNGVIEPDGVISYTRGYYDSSMHIIHISVCIYDGWKTITVDDIINDTQTKETINGHEGLVERDPDNGLYHFSYFDGDVLCTVSVEDENLFEQIIV